MEPLIEAFVEKLNGCIDSLKETESDNSELIKDLNAHTENINFNWQRFLTFEVNIDQEIQIRMSRISAQIEWTRK